MRTKKQPKLIVPNEPDIHYHECTNKNCEKPVFHRFGKQADCPHGKFLECPNCSKTAVAMHCDKPKQ